MSDTNDAAQGQVNQAGGAPGMSIVAQYIKDLSFENPNAPQSLQPGEQPSSTSTSMSAPSR